MLSVVEVEVMKGVNVFKNLAHNIVGVGKFIGKD
jgi:hypothetical protein